jgi:hypothetical protein
MVLLNSATERGARHAGVLPTLRQSRNGEEKKTEGGKEEGGRQRSKHERVEVEEFLVR